jgi:hypothetical protein
MSSIKDPQNEAKNPASMPRDQQGQGGHPADHDPEGQQGSVPHSRMAPQHGAQPGLEQDSRGNAIPLSQRTKDDQEKAAAARKDS